MLSNVGCYLGFLSLPKTNEDEAKAKFLSFIAVKMQ
jgi:hypothetical protein